MIRPVAAPCKIIFHLEFCKAGTNVVAKNRNNATSSNIVVRFTLFFTLLN